ncbi:sugar phosphate isomerase/epimerase family protein [Singulisphaera sp. Ch08]|uniref:Sugar phosphate isomerase/epimerase family protein n=1 Tax=Singulisphaera sp. Ch08 TaxID=3120278 RepID=A0AAU7C962_9BACT
MSLPWKKGIVIRAFADSGDFLAGTAFLRTLEDYSRVFRRAKQAGFDAVQPYLELEGGLLHLGTEAAQVREIASRAVDEGIDLPSLEIAPLQYSFTSNDAATRGRGVEVVRRVLEIAAELGARGVLVIPGYVGKPWDPKTDQVDYELAWDRTLAALRELAPHAEATGVTLLIEPIWNMFLLSPLEMRRLIDDVGSPRCGVLLDTGNVTLFGFAEQWMRILGPRVKEIHLKDFRRQVGNIHGFVPLLAGDVDWVALAQAASAAGFDGCWIAEQFPTERHGESVLDLTSAAMDRILGRLDPTE